jgi:hypothetical protein
MRLRVFSDPTSLKRLPLRCRHCLPCVLLKLLGLEFGSSLARSSSFLGCVLGRDAASSLQG